MKYLPSNTYEYLKHKTIKALQTKIHINCIRNVTKVGTGEKGNGNSLGEPRN